MKKSLTAVVLIFIFSYASLLSGQEERSLEYKIGPQDLLEIAVFGLDEMNKTVRVSEDGNITLPLLGEIEVKDLTKSQLEQRLARLLEEKYLQNPQVTIFIREYQSKRVSILGAVSEPGRYELLGRQTLLHMIAQAGGMTNEAGDEIIVVREKEDGTSKSLRISIDDLVLKGDPSLNIPLEPGDIVNVPIDMVVHIYVFGQVNSPGAIEVKKSNLPTLIQAIAQAGGFSERAAKGRVVIKRKNEEGVDEEIKVNVKAVMRGSKEDIQLEENDIVFVPETIF
ncbi:MAG: polysaccharide biosynthesis/export family protein [Candidatus Aminicenantes bacterium]|nr:polysaccharide biosynthesis/export family protein [Candidatus Aminicenantes bacterium]